MQEPQGLLPSQRSFIEVHYRNIGVSKTCFPAGVQFATYRLACMSPAASLARLGYFPVPALGAIGIVVAEVVTRRQG
jgi:hypothetical protein